MNKINKIPWTKIMWFSLLLIFCVAVSGVVSFSFSYRQPLDVESLIFSVAQLRAEFASTEEESNASAFLIDDSGYMFTNFHALSIDEEDDSFELANNVLVKFPDQIDYLTADIIKYDKTLDIALIRCGTLTSRKYLKFSNKELSYGQKCYAIGNSNNQGIVSFWNETFDNGFPNFGGQLHTVYVRKNQILSSGTNKFEYEVFNLTCKGKESKTYDTISDILKYANNLLNYPSNQFIWGYLLVE